MGVLNPLEPSPPLRVSAMRILPPLAALALPLLAGAHTAAAQQHHPPGSVLILQVRDPQGHAVSDAQVTVGGLRRPGRSDATGEVFITQIPAGNRQSR